MALTVLYVPYLRDSGFSAGGTHTEPIMTREKDNSTGYVAPTAQKIRGKRDHFRNTPKTRMSLPFRSVPRRNLSVGG